MGPIIFIRIVPQISYRHEIHNYKAIKNEVVAGIVEFCDGQLG